MINPLFIGLDLAWKPDVNPSGVAVLQHTANGVELAEVCSLRSLASVKDFLAKRAASTRVIAIDAPLVVPNEAGSRPCEVALSKSYATHGASCYPSNLTLFKGQPASALLAQWLAREVGFVHAPNATAGAKTMLEVYPHAAYIALTGREKIIKYKKGNVDARVAGLIEVQRELHGIVYGTNEVARNALLDELLSRAPSSMRGRARKSFEDELDAVLCAFIAYRYWKMGCEHCETFGDADMGYIVNPKRRVLRVGEG